MSYTLDYRAHFICDRCGVDTTLCGENEPGIPEGWAELSISIKAGWASELIQVCPTCLSAMGLPIIRE